MRLLHFIYSFYYFVYYLFIYADFICSFTACMSINLLNIIVDVSVWPENKLVDKTDKALIEYWVLTFVQL